MEDTEFEDAWNADEAPISDKEAERRSKIRQLKEQRDGSVSAESQEFDKAWNDLPAEEPTK